MTTTSTDSQTQPGPFKLLLGVLFRPARTMTALYAAKRRWWLIPALLTVLALAWAGLAHAQANADVLYQQQVEMMQSMPQDPRLSSGGGVEIPPPSGPHPLVVGLTIGGQVVSAIVGWLAWAGLITLSSTFLGHNGASFGAFFSMVIWARVPLALRSLIQAAYTTVTGSAIYNQGLSGLVLDSSPNATMSAMAGMVSSVVGGPMGGGMRYVPPTRSQQALAAILGRVDAYAIWSLVLTAVGIWAFTKAPRRKAFLVALGIWIVTLLLGALPKMLGLGAGTGIRLF